jgi:primosomal protein N' (replication factor Y)
VADLLARSELPAGSDVLGPVPVGALTPSHMPAAEGDDAVRALVRCGLGEGPALSRALRQAAGVRSARREPGSVRIRVDPADLP